MLHVDMPCILNAGYGISYESYLYSSNCRIRERESNNALLALRLGKEEVLTDLESGETK